MTTTAVRAPGTIFAAGPSITETEVAAVMDAVQNGWYERAYEYCERFQSEFAAYHGRRHALMTPNCTTAIHLLLAGLGVKDGDEVIVPECTWIGSTAGITYQRAVPVFCDIERDSWCLDPASVERAITPRTKAVIPVDYGGQVCDMPRINAIAAAHGITVIEDAAHAVGSALNGVRVGNLSRVTSFSFYATKNLTTGEGGMLTTNDAALAERVRVLALHGISADAWKRYSKEGSWFYEVLWPGYKYNMTDIQASLGLHQLQRLDGFVERRAAIAAEYTRAFADLSEIVTPIVRPGVHHAWHLYPIQLLPGRIRLDRSQFMAALAERGVGASVHFIPVHLHPYYRDTFGTGRGDLPVTERVYDGFVSLPLFPSMTPREVAKVIDTVRDLVAGSRV